MNLPLDNGLLLGIFRTVRGRNALWVVMLALVWVPLMSHCRLAAVDGMEFLQCAGHNDSDDHGPGALDGREAHPHDADHPGENDGCCSVEGAQFLTRDASDDLWLVASTGEVCQLSVAFAPRIQVSGHPSGRGIGIGPPPELNPSWRFLLRVSLPSRAPSLAS
ncbi:MAG: hypothetical protein JNK85_23635 [Verrucomicrobiales bacterium]|nr:hypothetical protein [Verrucomicrobiales bacterium]